jgi:hypothetical protein
MMCLQGCHETTIRFQHTYLCPAHLTQSHTCTVTSSPHSKQLPQKCVALLARIRPQHYMWPAVAAAGRPQFNACSSMLVGKVVFCAQDWSRTDPIGVTPESGRCGQYHAPPPANLQVREGWELPPGTGRWPCSGLWLDCLAGIPAWRPWNVMQ